nr:hypothetical protein [Actinomadura sp. HBU206391]
MVLVDIILPLLRDGSPRPWLGWTVLLPIPYMVLLCDDLDHGVGDGTESVPGVRRHDRNVTFTAASALVSDADEEFPAQDPQDLVTGVQMYSAVVIGGHAPGGEQQAGQAIVAACENTETWFLRHLEPLEPCHGLISDSSVDHGEDERQHRWSAGLTQQPGRDGHGPAAVDPVVDQ